MTSVAEVRLSCGRWYLSVCGFAVAMEGDNWSKEMLQYVADEINRRAVLRDGAGKEITG